jgi:hypothetical protein
MKLDTLRQSPFNCTYMGALRGACDHYGIGVTDAFLYGASGHAFVMNIHRLLCPSGPYCFNRDPINRLLENLGLRTTELGFYHSGSTTEERVAVDARIRDALDRGAACYLVNMEFQLITGYDETGFLTAQPWPGMDFPQAHMTFGSWAELGDEVHMDFDILDRCQAAPRPEAVRAGLGYAVDLWRNPRAHTSQDYGIGGEAYSNWISAIHAGHGSSHGNWWNGTVWAECRTQAAAFFREIAGLLPDDAPGLADDYSTVADLLERCSSKELPDDEKIGLLEDASRREAAATDRIERALAALG